MGSCPAPAGARRVDASTRCRPAPRRAPALCLAAGALTACAPEDAALPLTRVRVNEPSLSSPTWCRWRRAPTSAALEERTRCWSAIVSPRAGIAAELGPSPAVRSPGADAGQTPGQASVGTPHCEGSAADGGDAALGRGHVGRSRGGQSRCPARWRQAAAGSVDCGLSSAPAAQVAAEPCGRAGESDAAPAAQPSAGAVTAAPCPVCRPT